MLTALGYIHYRRSPAYSSETGVMIRANPYILRTLINSELNIQLNIKMTEILVKTSNNEDTKKEILELKDIHEKISKHVNERKFSNNKDLDYLQAKMKED